MSRNILVDVAVLMDLIRDKNYEVDDVKFIITKELYHSDVNKKQNRLSMPLNQILSDDFLNRDEKNRSTKNGVVVGFIGPCREETTLVLKKRLKKNYENYVLINDWYENAAKKNGLKKGHTVQVWFFRDNERPCFALVLDTAQAF